MNSHATLDLEARVLNASQLLDPKSATGAVARAARDDRARDGVTYRLGAAMTGECGPTFFTRASWPWPAMRQV